MVRRYLPSRNEYDRQAQRTYARSLSSRQARTRANLAQTYALKLEADGQTIGYTASDRPAFTSSQGADFSAFYNQLRSISYQARSEIIGSASRENLYSPTGEYAQLLVALGRRTPEDDWPVGMSPEGHLSNTVIPYLNSGGT